MRSYRERKSTMKLYVGNLSFTSTESEIRNAFSVYGTVDTVNLITDRDTGRAKGFGFVEMSTAAEANAAVKALHGQDLGGREARPKEDRPARGNFGGNR